MHPMSKTIQQALDQATDQLSKASLESPKLDAEILLAKLLNKDRSFLFAFNDKQLADQEIATYSNWIDERSHHKPVAHILGERDFWSFSLIVNQHTLIPRADTEILVEQALAKLVEKPDARVLDLGTGSGAIAIAIASEFPNAKVTATDASAEALSVAKQNLEQLGLNIKLFHGEWFCPLRRCEKFDLILSNPPYIRDQDPHLKQGDLPYEPITALVSGKDGLNDIRHIINHAPDYLTNNGWLMLEHGYDQADAVRDLLLERGVQSVLSEKDFGGNDRVSLGCWIED